MSQPLTAQQLAFLAREYTQLAATLATYENACAADPTVNIAPLGQQITQIDNIAQTLANQAMATLFDDAAQVYLNLAKITAHANQVAASLSQERDDLSRAAGIAASFITLGSALASGNPSAVVTAIVGCTKSTYG